MNPNDYDAMALAYSVDNEQNAWNALYERPAILGLASDVNGLRVLDAGCGAGAHAVALVERGANVSGFDLSEQLLAIARQRLGGQVPLVQADLNAALPYPDGQFDLVLSALVMHYVEDWAIPLGEFARILRKGGRLVFSTHHPFMDHVLAKGENYFATYAFKESWERGGQQVTMQFWHRPLSAMLQSLTRAGFSVERIDEPMPLESAREEFPDAYRTLTTSPRFIFFSARTIE
ncbi:class I SAM-dependent methyltransferase [Bradyrhizobium sp. CCGUVB1N3]|uniref:class I SAM-dependent methyltransferase n=1 Tax=Bradyrhizobium sp. CCGUVB1N3 TaxID=2949629 RepID=UPI0020B22816|nr:class I SAM-dependent methyltransferase [Bradyrhizobium sp. CCGUVB1N3]MCP3476470.1 class I SAM-dependent methyltransferase [Bradyrhizobium sp. CCGUVB1N3]